MTAIFGLVAFTLIFLVVDMMENLDDFLDRHASMSVIMLYYFYFIPEIIKLMIPVAMLLSALFTTGRLSTFNEMTALKSTGVSLYRFMAPLLIFAVLTSTALIYFNGWVVPRANKRKLDIGREYFQKNIEFVSKNNIFIQDSEARILSINMFDDQKNVAHQVSMQVFDKSDLTHLVARYDANSMAWNSTERSWTLTDCLERRFEGSAETVIHHTSLPVGALRFSPEDIRRKQEKTDEMDYNDLKSFIDDQQLAGHDVSRWLVDFYGKISFPFASFIVVLFGVPFSSLKRRSGLGVEFGIALAICFLYMILLKVSQAFGYNGDLNPLLTAWLANMLFLAAGIYNLWRVPK